MSSRKIVITGGPGTGKTSVINSLVERGYTCFPEISRQVTLEARELGVEQLFLEAPLLFSQKLLDGRTKQFFEAENFVQETVFIDRGIPDVIAYMDYSGEAYPENFIDACKNHIYDMIFLLPPWKDIYISDNERYENFDQAIKIHDFLEETYKRFGYDLIEVPTGKINTRTNFIEDIIKSI